MEYNFLLFHLRRDVKSQKLGLCASSRVRILKTLKQMTVLSSISRCLEPVKALALVFVTYCLKLKLKLELYHYTNFSGFRRGLRLFKGSVYLNHAQISDIA